MAALAERRSSTIVFHSPHEGHRPSQRGESAPQLLQYQMLLDLVAMGRGVYDVALRRNSATVMAVAIPTLSDSEVGDSGGYEGMRSRWVTQSATSGEMPCPSLPMTMMPVGVSGVR